MSGIEGLSRLRERYPRTALLMLSVYEDDERIFQALCAGASGYLLKKTPPEKLLEYLAEVLRGGAPHVSRGGAARGEACSARSARLKRVGIRFDSQ